MRSRKNAKFSLGFTIIEVMIVLAIAGLLLLILFLAIPAVNRNARNYDRKRFAETTATSLDAYANAHNLSYPMNQADMCDFFQNFVEPRLGSGAGCTPTYSNADTGGGPQHCVVEQIGRFTVCFHEIVSTPHAYIGPPDEISIMLGHWCNTPGSAYYYTDDAGHPVTSGHSHAQPDNEFKRYVVWTALETANSNANVTFCVDNYTSSG